VIRVDSTKGAQVAIATTNPSTGETVRSYDVLSDAALEQKLARASSAFLDWRRVSIGERTALLSRAADILEAEQDAIGRVMTLEMGKLAKAGRDEASKCAWGCRYYAEHAASMLADEPVESTATRSIVRFQPLGALLGVMPWNFPFWQVVRFAAPALAAGNVVLLKHASNVPQCALLLEDVFSRAGCPAGVFQSLLVEVDRVGPLIDDRRIAGVSLTGSEFAGRQVASRAGQQLKRAVLELGGSDPFIVLASADLETAIETGVRARMVNNGQSCIAAKRFIVVDAVADEFERGFTARVKALRVGDPLDESTEIGPLATERTVKELHDQVRRTVEAGARALVGGAPLDRPGYYYAPTVLTDVPRESPAFSEELFGPVASLYRVRDVDEAIRLANDTRFGLGCSVWTRDEAERGRVVDEIEAGQVFVNGMVVSDPRLPFGGIKSSGYGRELGVWGIREFVNVKTVWMHEPPVDKR
jgi:succinate-semialdehyde dehydrogenase/glutarate-semialdehyde dehydrogenase